MPSIDQQKQQLSQLEERWNSLNVRYASFVSRQEVLQQQRDKILKLLSTKGLTPDDLPTKIKQLQDDYAASLQQSTADMDAFEQELSALEKQVAAS